MPEFSAERPCRILSLDGGGAKGFYTIGALKGIEGMRGCRLHEKFDLVYGTSTGSNIAALICLGHSVDDIHDLYRTNIIEVMGRWLPGSKSEALADLAAKIFKDERFEATRTHIGIVATRWVSETPLIFKTAVDKAHGDRGNFLPGHGCTIGDAVQASCSAYPFFSKKILVTGDKESINAVDGGFCANNPTLYAIADAAEAFKVPREHIRVVSIGVGEYPTPSRWFTLSHWVGYLFTVRLLQKVLEINTKSMNQLRNILFGDVQTVCINTSFTEPTMAADMFEANL